MFNIEKHWPFLCSWQTTMPFKISADKNLVAPATLLMRGEERQKDGYR